MNKTTNHIILYTDRHTDIQGVVQEEAEGIRKEEVTRRKREKELKDLLKLL